MQLDLSGFVRRGLDSEVETSGHDRSLRGHGLYKRRQQPLTLAIEYGSFTWAGSWTLLACTSHTNLDRPQIFSCLTFSFSWTSTLIRRVNAYNCPSCHTTLLTSLLPTNYNSSSSQIPSSSSSNRREIDRRNTVVGLDVLCDCFILSSLFFAISIHRWHQRAFGLKGMVFAGFLETIPSRMPICGHVIMSRYPATRVMVQDSEKGGSRCQWRVLQRREL